MLPKKTDLLPTLPHQWPQSLSTLLPLSAQSLLTKQQNKTRQDFTLALEMFPDLDYEEFIHHWFLVSTRTFYWTAPSPSIPRPKGRKSPAAKRAFKKRVNEEKEKEKKLDHDDCISLAPFADMFNHMPNGSVSVTFTKDGYTLHALHNIAAGEELSISYGNHNNDFLLVEYGFLIPGSKNSWDEVRIDSLLEGLFDEKKKLLISGRGYWGNWVLDGQGICYRTKVAVALLCAGMTVGRWERMVDSGEDGGERVRDGIESIIARALNDYTSVIEQSLVDVNKLEEGSENQKEMLRERWKQVKMFVSKYLDSTRS